MARPDAAAQPCAHMLAAPAACPFDVVMAIDAYMGITDAVIRCAQCDRLYLLEMLRWHDDANQTREFRLSLVDAVAFDRLRHDVEGAYCDLNRKSAELYAFQTGARLTPWLLTLDVGAGSLLCATRVDPDTDLPTRSWRERLA